jgi:methionine-rich copper-binding protein CopC
VHAQSHGRSFPLPLAIAAALLTAFLILAPAPTASAHDDLVSSDPAFDSEVQTLPEQLTLTFSAALINAPDATAVVVTDAEGRSVTTGAPQLNGAVLTQPLSTDAAIAGEYQVVWQIVSSDGHPTDGEFSFRVANASAPAPTETTAAETAAPETAQPSAPPAEEPNMESEFSLSLPWIIGGAVVLVIAAFLIGVFITRRRRGTATSSDSEHPAER